GFRHHRRHAPEQILRLLDRLSLVVLHQVALFEDGTRVGGERHGARWRVDGKRHGDRTPRGKNGESVVAGWGRSNDGRTAFTQARRRAKANCGWAVGRLELLWCALLRREPRGGNVGRIVIPRQW